MCVICSYFGTELPILHATEGSKETVFDSVS